jgi:hypothetical protein
MNKSHHILFVFLIFTSLSLLHATDPETDKPNSELYHSIEVLSNFIGSEYFAELKYKHDDLALIDTIYLRSLYQMQYDHSEALLLLTFVTLPFNEFPFELPLINVQFGIPLPSASDSVFYIKTNNLPKQFFFDSPKTYFGDKDKMAHFFGNAFLSNNVGFFNLSKFLGILVELIEDAFSVGGYIDLRDMRINHLGELFGDLLNANENLLPSDVLKIYSILFYKHSNF